MLGLISQGLEWGLISEELSLRLHEGKPQGDEFSFSSGGVFF